MSDRDVEKDWKEFWEPIVCPNGKLDVEQVKKELSDFHYMIQQVPKVYMHITGDKLSKPNYPAETVIAEADEYNEECWQDYLKDETEELEAELNDERDRARGLVEAIRDAVAILRTTGADKQQAIKILDEAYRARGGNSREARCLHGNVINVITNCPRCDNDTP